MKLTTVAVLVLVLGLVALSGCTSQAPPAANTTPTANTVVTGNASPPADDGSALADELTGGTGTGANDISDDDLDEMSTDLDDLDVAVDEMAESDI